MSSPLRKAVFLPLDERILKLYKGYVLKGIAMPELKEEDIYNIVEYKKDSFADVQLWKRIISLLILIPLTPILFIILGIAHLLKKYKETEEWLTQRLLSFGDLFLERETGTRKEIKTEFLFIDTEDVAAFLTHCASCEVPVYIYSYTDYTPAQIAVLEDLHQKGWVEKWMILDTLPNLSAILEKDNIQCYNSLIVVSTPEECVAAATLGFPTAPSPFCSIELWAREGHAPYSTQTPFGRYSIHTLSNLKKNVQYYHYSPKGNSLLSADTVLLMQDKPDTLLDNYIRRHLPELNSLFATIDKQLIYLPAVVEADMALSPQLLTFLRYQFPALYALEDAALTAAAQQLLQQINASTIYENLLRELDLPYFKKPALVRLLDVSLRGDWFSYVCRPLDACKDEEELDAFFRYYVDRVRKSPGASSRDMLFSLENIGDGSIEKVELKKLYEEEERSAEAEGALHTDKYQYDADALFEVAGKQDTEELKIKVDAILQTGKQEMLASLFIYLVQQLQANNPQLLAQLKPLLNNPIQQKTTIQLSPIVVDKHYKITLPEFGNIEIKLHALPKALYLLFLKHPEGIRFKELFEYKQELSDIYNKLSNQTDKTEIERAIKDLVDMTKPNINMQCSRIRAAFRKVMEESIAQHYYIDGQNGAPKKILLEQTKRHLHY